MLQAHRAQDLGRVQGIFADLRGQLHILQGGQIRHQVVKLEDKTDVVTAVCSQLTGVVGGDFLAAQKDFPFRQRVHPS